MFIIALLFFSVNAGFFLSHVFFIKFLKKPDLCKEGKNPSEKTYSVWTSGVNNWVKWEEKCGSGTAVSFWNRGDSIKGE